MAHLILAVLIVGLLLSLLGVSRQFTTRLAQHPTLLLLNERGAFFNEAWFIQGVNTAVRQLSQQKKRKITGAIRWEEGVTGKTWPFQRIGSLDMVDATRDSDTTYLNPPQSKRRAVLLDKNAAVLLDRLDQVRELINPMSEFTQILVYARERQLDRFALSVPGLSAAGVAGTAVGGILGLATVVDEAAESTSLAALPTGQQIVNGGTGLTMAKILQAKQLMDTAEVEEDDRFFFYSPIGMQKLLSDTQVTSSDYNTIQSLTRGGFAEDQSWVGFKWRMTNRLPKAGNIRACVAVQRMCAAMAVGLITDIDVSMAPHKWNNPQAICKLSAGVVRVDDTGVVQVDIDESV